MKFPFSQKIQLEPVRIDADDQEDELMQAILNDPIEHDNTWRLDKFADAEEVTHFWEQVDAAENEADGG